MRCAVLKIAFFAANLEAGDAAQGCTLSVWCLCWAGEQKEAAQLCPSLALLKAGGDAISLHAGSVCLMPYA